MVKLSVTEAARQAGVSRQHFYRKYVTPGKITVERDHEGNPTIDTSELLRVFGQLGGATVGSDTGDVTMLREETSKSDGETVVLRAQLELVREQLREAKDREVWLQQQVEKLTDTVKLLEHRPEPKKGLWARIFGG